MIYVLAYLGAAVAANVAVSTFGPWALPFTACAMIPFDLVARDVLHDRWQGRWLAARMAALVLGGSLVSLVSAAPSVCLASFLAFLAAGTADTVVYHRLRASRRLVRMNASNCVSGAIDSIVFPAIAFGLFDPVLSGTQAAMKIGGGAVWSLILRGRHELHADYRVGHGAQGIQARVEMQPAPRPSV